MRIPALLILALVAASAPLPANADCAFNLPAKAGSMRTSLVRSFRGCPTPEIVSGNTQTSGGVTACTPVEPQDDGAYGDYGNTTPYEFSPSGSCSLSIKSKVVKDCATLADASGNALNLPAGACHVDYWRVKCSGIVDGFGAAIDGAGVGGFSLYTRMRWTVDDPANGPMTLVDVPVTFVFGDPSGGKMEIDTTSAEALIPLVGAAGAALPPCATAELREAYLQDPSGLVFARMGMGTPGL